MSVIRRSLAVAVAAGALIAISGAGPAGWIISVTGNTRNYEGNWAVLLENAADIDRTMTLDPEITNV